MHSVSRSNDLLIMRLNILHSYQPADSFPTTKVRGEFWWGPLDNADFAFLRKVCKDTRGRAISVNLLIE